MILLVPGCIGAFVSLVLLSLKDFLGAAFSSNRLVNRLNTSEKDGV